MVKYSWFYGIFHWIVHILLTASLVLIFNISIIANPVLNMVTLILISALIDLDHIPVLLRLGPNGLLKAEKRVPSPFHTFFFILLFALVSALLFIFQSTTLAVIALSVVFHLLWDFTEDVTIFGIKTDRWKMIVTGDSRELAKVEKEVKRKRR